MMWQPRVQTSPTSPIAAVFPVSGLTILVSMLGSGRPMVPALSSIESVVIVIAATGEHSVCPNTIVKGAPSFFSSEVTKAAGTVEPPEQMALTDERSVVAKEGCSIMATSIVDHQQAGRAR